MGRGQQMKIRVRVIPHSKTEEVATEGDWFLVRVKEPPKEGRANQAVIRLLAQYLSVPRDSVRISSGLKSRNKVIDVAGI